MNQMQRKKEEGKNERKVKEGLCVQVLNELFRLKE